MHLRLLCVDHKETVRRLPGLVSGHAPAGRRFERIDEVYFFTFDGDRIADAWGVEDTLERFRQLGLDP